MLTFYHRNKMVAEGEGEGKESLMKNTRMFVCSWGSFRRENIFLTQKKEGRLDQGNIWRRQ